MRITLQKPGSSQAPSKWLSRWLVHAAGYPASGQSARNIGSSLGGTRSVSPWIRAPFLLPLHSPAPRHQCPLLSSRHRPLETLIRCTAAPLLHSAPRVRSFEPPPTLIFLSQPKTRSASPIEVFDCLSLDLTCEPRSFCRTHRLPVFSLLFLRQLMTILDLSRFQ
jgi:hypothetical protein